MLLPKTLPRSFLNNTGEPCNPLALETDLLVTSKIQGLDGNCLVQPGCGALLAGLTLDSGAWSSERIKTGSDVREPPCGLPCFVYGAEELRAAVSEAIHSGISFEDATAEAERARAAGAEVVAFQDPRYPQRLREIYDPPILLYARGRTELLSSDSVAIVGSRRPSPYGTGVAQKFGRELCRAGLTVISGMARGIDTWAHRGALEAGVETVAVLGCGVDVVYPRENQQIMRDIVKKGLVVSEFPMGSTAFPQNFPIRNRVISGLSLGVMVVEGAQYSGSLITARLALDQGREVFAVPGSIASKSSWGPNLLIKQGAKLVQETTDILEELPLAVRRQAAERSEEAAKDGETSAPDQASIWQGSASPLGKHLLSLIRVDSSVHIDELIRLCEGRSSASVLAALSELELFGVVKQLPGKHFVRVWSS